MGCLLLDSKRPADSSTGYNLAEEYQTMFKNSAAQKLLIVVITGTVFALSGCTQPTGNDQAGPTFRIHLRYGAPSEKAGLPGDGGAPQYRLAKASSPVEDQVLLLNCDDQNLIVATDESGYYNDFTLNNITYEASANADLKYAMSFNGRNGYAISKNYGSQGDELNGTLGLKLSFRMVLNATGDLPEQRIFDRHDELGGYTVGLYTAAGTADYLPRLYFRIRQNGIDTRVDGKTVLISGQEYRVTVEYDQSHLNLILNDALEATVAATGEVSPSLRPTLIGAGWNGDVAGFYFRGKLDQISLTTKVEYIDLSRLTIAVINLSEYATSSEFWESDAYYHYHLAEEEMYFPESATLPTWNDYVKLWTEHFELVSNQELSTKGAFAEGTIRGVEGLNWIKVAGILDGVMAYRGDEFVAVSGAGTTDVWINIFQESGMGF